MTAYQILDHSSHPTIDSFNLATPLTFASFAPPIGAVGDPLDWDFKAFFSTSIIDNHAQRLFSFEGIAGATYDIFSESFYDPLVLKLFDDQANVLASDDQSGGHGTDHIKFIAPYDGIYYVDAAWHQGLAEANQYASIAVYENLDTKPPLASASIPSIVEFSPANLAAAVPVDSDIVLTFSEMIQRGSGFIAIRNAQNSLIESFDAATSSHISLSGKTLTLHPTNDLSGGTQYFVTLDSGSIKDLVGNKNSLMGSYSFTTVQTPGFPEPLPSVERIFNWGESRYPDLFPDHPESLDVFGYHARIYSNGNAIGEQNGNIYYYDGGTDGTGNIALVGAIADFLPQAIVAGY